MSKRQGSGLEIYQVGGIREEIWLKRLLIHQDVTLIEGLITTYHGQEQAAPEALEEITVSRSHCNPKTIVQLLNPLII